MAYSTSLQTLAMIQSLQTIETMRGVPGKVHWTRGFGRWRAPAFSPDQMLRLLLACAIGLPILLFSATSWISYRNHFSEAADRLTRTAIIVAETASRVFETQELAIRQVDQMLNGLSDADIQQQEEQLHNRVKFLTDTLNQIQDITVIGATGHGLLSALIYPVPRDLDVSDRDYFRVHQEATTPPGGTYVSDVVRGRVRGVPFFLMSRRRTGPDTASFAGVITVSADRKYFESYYSRVAALGFSTLVLARRDGPVLARYPAADDFEKLPAGGAFDRAVTKDPEYGIYDARAALDDVWRRVAYQKVGAYPVYITVSRDHSAIRSDWLATMSGHLIFGIPATLGLIGLVLFARRRVLQQTLALQRLQLETERREVAEGQLRQAYKLEAIGQLTGGLAHDFNNLLTIVIGNLDTLRRRLASASVNAAIGEVTGRFDRPLEFALRGARSAAELTHRLLAFSRRQALQPVKLDLNRLVSDMSELLRRTLGEAISIETILAGGLWATFADYNQLESALLNLAVNARDAMPDGGSLTIETANAYLDDVYARRFGDVTPGQYVVLSVTDSGKGIPSDVIEKVFEPFFTTKETGAGSGLGLAMVHGFVKQSGGHVRIYSEVGTGTTVKIYLPRLLQNEATIAVPTERTPDDGELPRAHSGEVILVVEDNPGVRQYARSVLTDLGYDVADASDANEAFAIIQTGRRIDLLFVDVVLPHPMNGRELARKIRSMHPTMPVLFTTGYTRNAIVHEGRLDSDVHLINKPYTQRDLARKVRELLDAAPSDQPVN